MAPKNKKQPPKHTNNGASSQTIPSLSVAKKAPMGVANLNFVSERALAQSPSTNRAVALQGTREVALYTFRGSHIPGREKMELLCEDDMKLNVDIWRKSEKHDAANMQLSAPFKLEILEKIAQSQMDKYLDVIKTLHIPNENGAFRLFADEIGSLSLKTDSNAKKDGTIARQVGTFIHNMYMLASAWKAVYVGICMIREKGLDDGKVFQQLKADQEMAHLYLTLFELVKKITELGQSRLRLKLQVSDKFSKFFKINDGNSNVSEFNQLASRDAFLNFLDTTLVELCLPNSKFTLSALYNCLHAVETEDPKQTHRYLQSVADAIGDLAEAVRVFEALEGPVLNKDDLGHAAALEEVRVWEDKQDLSIRAATVISSFTSTVNPLTNLKSNDKLTKLWESVNQNYEKLTQEELNEGQGIADYWDLKEALEQGIFFPRPSNYKPEEDDAIIGGSAKKQKQVEGGMRKLAIKEREEESDNDSIPGLISGSDSEDDDFEDYYDLSSDESDFSSDEESDDESWDDDDNMNFKAFERELFEKLQTNEPIFSDKYAEERKKNPFLNLLGNLKGRLFPNNSALRSDGKATSASKPKKKKNAAVKAAQEIVAAQKASQEAGAGAGAGGEGDQQSKSSKKKKKKGKKTGDAEEGAQSPISQPPFSPISEAKSPTTPATTITSPVSPAKSINAQLDPFASQTSLPLATETKAQSARSYLQTLPETKTKVKSRPEGNTSIFSSFKKLGASAEDDDENEQPQPQTSSGASLSSFSRLKKGMAEGAKRLFGVGSTERKGHLRWDKFVDIMKAVGFTPDPSTAGSSVRFDYKDNAMRSITIHKPHPDSTLHTYHLWTIRRKLQQYYGWTPEDLNKVLADEDFNKMEAEEAKRITN